MTTPARRLGRAIAEKRGALGVSQQGLADRVLGDRGDHLGTIRRLEQAARRRGEGPQPGRPHEMTLAGLDRALDWPLGTCGRIWDGEAPPADVGVVEVKVESLDEAARVLIAALGGISETQRQQAVKVALAALRAMRDDDDSAQQTPNA